MFLFLILLFLLLLLYIYTNTRFFLFFKKKKNQLYINAPLSEPFGYTWRFEVAWAKEEVPGSQDLRRFG